MKPHIYWVFIFGQQFLSVLGIHCQFKKCLNVWSTKVQLRWPYIPLNKKKATEVRTSTKVKLYGKDKHTDITTLTKVCDQPQCQADVSMARIETKHASNLTKLYRRKHFKHRNPDTD